MDDFRKPLKLFDRKYPAMKTWGVYMFLLQSEIIDVGQVAGTGRALRTRIKNETSNASTFHGELGEIEADRLELTVKVAHVAKATEDDKPIVIDLDDIELALICETYPRIKMHNIKHWRREDIEISGSGNFAPLPPIIRKVKGEKCLGA